MKIAHKLLLGIVLLQGAAYAADEPKIEVVDGKISMSAQAVSLDRLLNMFDRAMGTKSEIKNGLGNRNVSVQFTGLNFNEAVKRIFQGQPLNYIAVQGKGIKVLELQTGSPDTGSSSSASSFPSSSSFSTTTFNSPVQPIQNNNPVQPSPAAGIFGGPPPAPAATNPTAPMTGPGTIAPAPGAINPLNNPPPVPNGAGASVVPSSQPQAPAQPAGPGVIPGAAPGTIK
jgi:hypothetical protein